MCILYSFSITIIRDSPFSLSLFTCMNSKESTNHLLIHYGKVRGLWHLLFSPFGCSLVLPFFVKDLLKGWHGSFVSKK